MSKAGTIEFDLLANLQGLDSALKRASASLQSVGDSLTRAGTNLTAGITLPLAAAGGAAAHFAADFQQTMTTIITLVGVSEDRVAQWTEAIKAMAPAVGVGPGELARAMFVITSAGQRGSEALKILEQAAKASAVGLGDTATIARAVTSAVNAYGPANLSAAQATDVLVATVREGNLDAASLAGTLGRVISLASTLGVSFADVGTFIATFTRQGVAADEAVTALRGTLSILLHPSTQAKQALAQLGLSMEDLRKVARDQGLVQALQLLVNSFKGNDEALGLVIPNIRALAGVLGTAGTQSQTFAEIQHNIANSLGITDAGFKRTQQTAAQQFRELKAQAEVVAVAVGERLLPTLQDLLHAVAPILTKVADLAAAFGRLPAGLQEAAVGAGLFLTALGPTLYIAGSIIKAVGSLANILRAVLVPAIQGVITVLSALGVTGGVAVAAMVALGLGVLQTIRHWDFFRMQFEAIWTLIRDAVFTGVEFILGVLSKLPVVGDKFAEVRAAVVTEHDKMLAAAGDRLAKLTQAWQDAERKIAGIGGELVQGGNVTPTAGPTGGSTKGTTVPHHQIVSEDLLKAQAEFAAQLRTIEALEQRLGASFDGTTEEAGLYRAAIEKLMEKGATWNSVVGPEGETLGDLADRYQKLEKTIKIVTKAQQEWQAEQEKAKSVIEELQTPTERYAARIAELNTLHEAGLLSADQFSRGLKQAEVEMGKAVDVSDALRTSLADAFTALGQQLGQTLANIASGVQSIGSAIVGILGNLLVTVGRTLIAFGTAGIAIKAFALNPFAAIAAGIALTALGSALAASAQKSVAAAGQAMASGGGGAVPATPPPPSPQQTGSASPAQQIVLEFQDPSRPGVVQRIVASANRLHSRDATVSVPLAVIGTGS